MIMLALVSQASLGNDLVRFYQLALQRDPALQAAAAQRAAAVEARPQALSQLLPQLLATGSVTRDRIGSEAALLTGPVSGNCTVSADAQMGRCRGDIYGYDLTLSQILWSYEAFGRLKEANRQAASAEATFMGAQQDLLLRVARAYFGILAARDQLEATHSERAAFGVLLGQAKGRERSGVGPRSDVEQAQSFYDATEQRVIDAQNALDDARLALTQIIGTSVEEIARLQETIPLASPEPASAENWVASALRDNPALRAAELRAQAAGYNIAVQQGKGLPVLSLVGVNSQTWQDSVLGGDQTFDTVGLTFSWPLFQGGAVASALRESRGLYRQAQAEYETTLRATESQTRAAYRGVVTGIQRIAAAARAVDSARAAVEASKRNVEFGTGTHFDLLNAQNLYSIAVRAYSQTRYDYLTHLLTLKQQSGRLSEQDLAAIDALLVAPGP